MKRRHACAVIPLGMALVAALLGTPVSAKPEPAAKPKSYAQLFRACRQWARRYDAEFDVYEDPTTGQRHAYGAHAAMFQFSKCMTMNGYPTDLVPDGRQVQ